MKKKNNDLCGDHACPYIRPSPYLSKKYFFFPEICFSQHLSSRHEFRENTLIDSHTMLKAISAFLSTFYVSWPTGLNFGITSVMVRTYSEYDVRKNLSFSAVLFVRQQM